MGTPRSHATTEPRTAPHLSKPSTASLEIEDDEPDDDWENGSEQDQGMVEHPNADRTLPQIELPTDAFMSNESDDLTEEHPYKEGPTVRVKRPPEAGLGSPNPLTQLTKQLLNDFTGPISIHLPLVVLHDLAHDSSHFAHGRGPRCRNGFFHPLPRLVIVRQRR